MTDVEGLKAQHIERVYYMRVAKILFLALMSPILILQMVGQNLWY
jgi:hypothetical protein